MPAQRHYLVEIDALVSGSPVTLRASTHGYTSRPTDSPANTAYPEIVADPGRFRRDLFGPGRTMGQSEVDYGEIVLNNAGGEIDAWKDYALTGREVRVYSIASRSSALSSRVLLLRANVEALNARRALTQWTLRLRGRRLDLERPMQTVLYAGTTSGADETAEGGADLAGQVKPRVFGKVFNARPRLVNQNFQLYQVSAAALSAVAVYDGGVPLSLESDVTTLGDLCDGEIPGGEYRSALNLGIVRVRSTSSMITCDATEGATAADRYPGAVAQRILLAAGIDGADITSAGFDALDAAAAYEVGIYVDSDLAALTVLREVVQSAGGWVSPNGAGVFEAGQLAAPASPTATIGANGYFDDDINLALNPDTTGIPAWRVIVRYARNYQVQAGAGVYPCVSESRKDFLRAEWRQAIAEDTDVLAAYPLAPELTFDTLLTDADDAAAEAARRHALYKVNRDLIGPVPVLLDDEADYPAGGIVSVVHPRLGLASGKPMVIAGRRLRLADEMCDLTLWG